MALIKCPECGKEISDKAQNCIGCGYPISEDNKEYMLIVKLSNDCPIEKPLYLKEPFDVVGLYDESGSLLLTFKYGETKKIPLKENMKVYAEHLPVNTMTGTTNDFLIKTVKKTRSELFYVSAGRDVRIQIGGIRKFLHLGFQFVISEVDVIDSAD